jgi:hypothetical protein
VWLFTCDMSFHLSRERGAPVLTVRLHNEDGEVADYGTWAFDSMGAWSRCAD